MVKGNKALVGLDCVVVGRTDILVDARSFGRVENCEGNALSVVVVTGSVFGVLELTRGLAVVDETREAVIVVTCVVVGNGPPSQSTVTSPEPVISYILSASNSCTTYDRFHRS